MFFSFNIFFPYHPPPLIHSQEWIPILASKQAALHGMSQYHQSCVCKAQNSYGEEIARLDYAHELLETAKERGKDHIKFEDWLEKISKARTAGKWGRFWMTAGYVAFKMF